MDFNVRIIEKYMMDFNVHPFVLAVIIEKSVMDFNVSADIHDSEWNIMFL